MHKVYLADAVCDADKEPYWDNVTLYNCELVIEHASLRNGPKSFIFVKWPTERWLIGGLMDEELDSELSTMSLTGWKIVIPMFKRIPVGKYTVYKILIYAYKDFDDGDDESLAKPKRAKCVWDNDEFPDFVPRRFGKGTFVLS